MDVWYLICLIAAGLLFGGITLRYTEIYRIITVSDTGCPQSQIIETVETDFAVSKQKSILGKCKKAIEERESLSKRLNEAIRKNGLLQCQVKKTTSDTGGWCDGRLSISHETDKYLAIALAHVFRHTAVGSFGEGPGNYRKLILASRLVKTYDAYDGSPNIEMATQGQVKFLDLTIPHYGLPIYDWVISLEVAEHVPKQFEQIYLGNLFRHAKVGIVISWAAPGQGGYNHVNEKSKSYVVETFRLNCFDINSGKTNTLIQNATYWWLKKNILAFTRRSTCPIDNDDA